MATWRETKPTNTDPLDEFPSLLTGQAVAFRQAIEKHSYWTDASGASAGIPRLSDGSPGPGSARAFYAPASSLSTALSATKALAGRLFVTSDTHRLYAYTSTATLQLGAENLIAYYGASYATITAGTRILTQSSNTSIPINSRVTVAFPTPYAVTPTLQVTAGSTLTTDLFHASVFASTATNVTLVVNRVFGSSATTCTVWWRSHGTVAL